MLGLAGMGALLAASGGRLGAVPETAAPPPSRPVPNAPVYRFRIGDIEAAAMVTGFMDAAPARPPGVSEADFRAAAAALDYPGKLRLHFNALLLRTGRENILIDAGPGGKQPRHFDVVEHLAALGLGPADITAVLVTHAHFDHTGGLLDAVGQPVFRRAEHFCLAEEIDFWTAEKPDFSRLRMKPDGLLKSARRVFGGIAFTRITAGRRLPGEVTPIAAPGHTPGHLTLEIRSRGEVLYHIGDLIHHAALLARPEWPAISDIDGELAVATRQKVFARLAAQGTRVFGSHLPFPGLGRLKAEGAGYRWIPELWDAGV